VIDEAIRAMRDAVQNAEDPDAWIGEPADVEAVVWCPWGRQKRVEPEK
jgi:hypothetical protein